MSCVSKKCGDAKKVVFGGLLCGLALPTESPKT